MISRAEYYANSELLTELGQKHEQQLTDRLSNITADQSTGSAGGEVAIRQSIEIAQENTAVYHAAFEDLLSTALAQTGNTTVDHYDRVLNTNLTDIQKQEIVAEAIMRQTTEPYYGATLDQRLAGSRMVASGRIQRSARVGKTLETRQLNLTRIYLNPYPFGAQTLLDNRIMLSQCVKLEHDIARSMAKVSDVAIVKWTLSEKHKLKDICDSYAEYVDLEVVKFFAANDIHVDPKGCYFIDELPEPPHPNCQCSLRMIHRGKLTSNVVERVMERLKELLGRFRRKPKN